MGRYLLLSALPCFFSLFSDSLDPLGLVEARFQKVKSSHFVDLPLLFKGFMGTVVVPCLFILNL